MSATIPGAIFALFFKHIFLRHLQLGSSKRVLALILEEVTIERVVIFLSNSYFVIFPGGH